MIQITMPRLSDTMEEGAISQWYKQPGEHVDAGEPLVEIETDKATMDYEAYDSGTLTKILVPEGELVPIGTPIAELDDGTAPQEPPAGAPKGATAQPPDLPEAPAPSALTDTAGRPPASEPAPIAAETAAAQPSGSAALTGTPRILATPVVRAIARENDIDLTRVRGSGPGGRIVKHDVEALLGGAPQTDSRAPEAPAPAPQPPAAPPADDRRGSEEVPLSSVRRVIARRLGASAREIPHFYVTAVADAEELMRLRAELNERLVAAGRPKVSVNDLLIRAAALALRQHPLVNASYNDDDATTMLVHHRVNIGVAVASENGLVVSVIDDADRKTVTQLGAEAHELVALANDRKLTPEQMSGGTFTISNLGMLGVEEFTAIINPPESAILAVGTTRREPVAVGEEIAARYQMRYTLSADHRIIDGALAARFLQTLTSLIEDPWTILA